MSDKILDSNHIRLDKIPSLDSKGEPGNSKHFGKGRTFTTTKSENHFEHEYHKKEVFDILNFSF